MNVACQRYFMFSVIYKASGPIVRESIYRGKKVSRIIKHSLNFISTETTSIMPVNESATDGKKEEVDKLQQNGEVEEQFVGIEKVVAKDNKGIDYEKLISMCSLRL